MKEERLAFRQDNLVAHHAIQRGADFVFRSAKIDKRRGMATEHAELIAQADIYCGPVDAFERRARGNHQFLAIQPSFYIAVTQSHVSLLHQNA